MDFVKALDSLLTSFEDQRVRHALFELFGFHDEIAALKKEFGHAQ